MTHESPHLYLLGVAIGIVTPFVIFGAFTGAFYLGEALVAIARML